MLDTFSLDGYVDEASAFVDMVCFLVKLQRWLILSVVNVHDGPYVSTQQSVHRHAQLHVEALSSLKHFVVINDDGAHLGVLTLIELYLWIQRKDSGVGEYGFWFMIEHAT